MKLSTCLLASSAIYATQALDPACPNAHCEGNEIVTIAPTVDSSINCPNLEVVTLDTFTYNGDVLVELLGPANMTTAADLLISAPHGGALKPDYVADRTWGTYKYADSNTKEISVVRDKGRYEHGLTLSLCARCACAEPVFRRLHRIHS